MAVTLNKANLVLKDANGNIGKIEQLSDRDLTKIRTAVSDVALVVNQSNHKPIEATTTNKGVVQLATSADVVSGASDKVVTAEQLHNATTTIKATQDGAGNVITDTYVKKTGDTLSGILTFTNRWLLRREVNNDGALITGGTEWTKSANLQLYGGENADASGTFILMANNGSTIYDLVGKPTGELIWGDKHIVRSVNGIKADNVGNVSLISSVPIGMVLFYAGEDTPAGYLLCAGGAVSRTTYANLFAKIGTKYGAGDGSTTFNLPNLIDRFVQGNATAGTYIGAGLPNINGNADGYMNLETSNGALIVTNQSRGYHGNDDDFYHGLIFNAANSNSIYGNSTTVQPPALTLRPIIKY